jgi:hypothetical protein
MGIEQGGRAADGHQRIERGISVQVVPDEEQEERLVGDSKLGRRQGGSIPALPALGSDDLHTVRCGRPSRLGHLRFVVTEGHDDPFDTLSADRPDRALDERHAPKRSKSFEPPEVSGLSRWE